MPTNEELVEQYKSGDFMVLGELTQNNMGLIHMVANKYSARCSFIDNEDLVQEGWTGFFRLLLEASEEQGNTPH